MTVVMGAGVAIMQVTMPPAVRNWASQRIGFATAVYTNGLLIGEILPVALTLPLVLPWSAAAGNGALWCGACRSRQSPCWCCVGAAARGDERRFGDGAAGGRTGTVR